MTKIKFIDARFADPDEDEFALKRRFEWHLRKLRALRDGVTSMAFFRWVLQTNAACRATRHDPGAAIGPLG